MQSHNANAYFASCKKTKEKRYIFFNSQICIFLFFVCYIKACKTTQPNRAEQIHCNHRHADRHRILPRQQNKTPENNPTTPKLDQYRLINRHKRGRTKIKDPARPKIQKVEIKLLCVNP